MQEETRMFLFVLKTDEYVYSNVSRTHEQKYNMNHIDKIQHSSSHIKRVKRKK